MKNIIDMIELKKNLSNEAERILDNAEGGVLNKAQKIEFDNLLGRVKELSAEIDCEAVRLENKPYMDKAIKFPPGGICRPSPKNPASKKYSGIFCGADDSALNNGGFDSLEDFLKTVHSGRADERLVQCSMVEGVPDLAAFRYLRNMRHLFSTAHSKPRLYGPARRFSLCSHRQEKPRPLITATVPKAFSAALPGNG